MALEALVSVFLVAVVVLVAAVVALPDNTEVAVVADDVVRNGAEVAEAAGDDIGVVADDAEAVDNIGAVAVAVVSVVQNLSVCKTHLGNATVATVAD